MNSFNTNDQQQFGRHVRLAMACIEGKDEPANIKALPDDDNSLFDFERALRDDRESFDTIRALSPTRYRFRIVDANGCDIRYVYDANVRASTSTNTNTNTNTNTLTPEAPQQATRVACAESPPSTYGFTKTRSLWRTRWATAEQSAVYHVNSSAYLH